MPPRLRRATWARAFRAQASLCGARGSPLYAALLLQAAIDIEACGPVWLLFDSHELSYPMQGVSLPLSFLAAVHRLVLRGDAPALTGFYPSVGGKEPPGRAWPVFRDVVAVHHEEIRGGLGRPVQTNDVGRCQVLVGGFLLVAGRTGLPLRLLEIGASAGLNLRWDHYHYQAGDTTWGDPGSPVRPPDGFIKGRPPFDGTADVADRAGCDLAPVDPRSDEGRLALMSYVWPDDVQRVELLRGALEVASRIDAPVERADAADWLTARLGLPTPGVATVVFHSCFMQYVDHRTRTRIEGTIERAGRSAQPDAPVAWLRLESGRGADRLELTTWPGGDTVLLATSDPYGRTIAWRGGA